MEVFVLERWHVTRLIQMTEPDMYQSHTDTYTTLHNNTSNLDEQ